MKTLRCLIPLTRGKMEDTVAEGSDGLEGGVMLRAVSSGASGVSAISEISADYLFLSFCLVRVNSGLWYCTDGSSVHVPFILAYYMSLTLLSNEGLMPLAIHIRLLIRLLMRLVVVVA